MPDIEPDIEPDLELDINYLVSCIESINQISTIPAADGLKKVVNRWVDERTDEALTDPDIRLQIYSIWKRLTGDADSVRVVEVISKLPENVLAVEIRQFLLSKVNEQLNEAAKDPANRMLFFRSWLAAPPKIDPQITWGVVDEPLPDGGSGDKPPDPDEPHRPW